MVLNSTIAHLPPDFLSDYERLNWSDDDFLLDDALASPAPMVWDATNVRYDEIRKQSYADFLHASHMMAGIVVPLSSRPETSSALAVNWDDGRTLEPGTIQAAAILANAAQSRAELLGLCPEVSADEASATAALSPIQVEVLSWIAEGKSNRDIATIIDQNERLVRYHVTEILRKLGVATRMQAAAIKNNVLR